MMKLGICALYKNLGRVRMGGGCSELLNTVELYLMSAIRKKSQELTVKSKDQAGLCEEEICVKFCVCLKTVTEN